MSKKRTTTRKNSVVKPTFGKTRDSLPRKSARTSRPVVSAGTVSDISGSVNIARGNITTYNTTTGTSVAKIR